MACFLEELKTIGKEYMDSVLDDDSTIDENNWSTRRKIVNWTPEEELKLKELYSNHSNIYIAKALNKTKASIDKKGAILGLKKSISYRKIISRQNNKNKRHAWTENEISFLKDNFSEKTYYEIADALNRTPTAVSQKARQINLKKYQKKAE